jgi:hypothetical protein
VITAHSGREAVELFQTFPGVAGVIVHSYITDIDCETVIRTVKEKVPHAITVFLSAGVASHCDRADHVVSSYDPEALLNLLRRLFGDPRTDRNRAAQPKLVS